MSKALAALPAWLINLDRSPDRLAAMEAGISRLQAPFRVERFSAVDGKADPGLVARYVDEAAFRRHIGRAILPGEIGVYLSHLGVWQAFLATGQDVALVMEDDVVFHDDFLPALEVALENRHRWGMLKLNKIRAKGPVKQFEAGGYSFNAYLGIATGFGAYLITREAAELLVAKALPVRMPVDHFTARYPEIGLSLLGMEPFPSHVDDGGQSTITGKAFSEVKKAPPLQRLPSYWWRLTGDMGRIWWWLRHRRG